ncbi:hypothetical protein [Amycolatopsis sp. NPDC059021]
MERETLDLSLQELETTTAPDWGRSEWLDIAGAALGLGAIAIT